MVTPVIQLSEKLLDTDMDLCCTSAEFIHLILARVEDWKYKYTSTKMIQLGNLKHKVKLLLLWLHPSEFIFSFYVYPYFLCVLRLLPLRLLVALMGISGALGLARLCWTLHLFTVSWAISSPLFAHRSGLSLCFKCQHWTSARLKTIQRFAECLTEYLGWCEQPSQHAARLSPGPEFSSCGCKTCDQPALIGFKWMEIHPRPCGSFSWAKAYIYIHKSL